MPFFYNCTGPHINEQKSKHELDHQMLSYIVQEKHQEKLKIIVIQSILSHHFLSVNMKDPAYYYRILQFLSGCGLTVCGGVAV